MFSFTIVQNFEGVAVEDGDDGAVKSAAKEKLAVSTAAKD